jgi:glycogen debranching enzyme
MYVLALDGEKRPCRVRTSNAGRCCSRDRGAGACGAHRLGPELGRIPHGLGHPHGERAEHRFNPTSYHNGSIWPHDNSLIALGLARYGHSDLAARLTTAVLDAAINMDLRRLPELYCGMRRRRDKGPILYPVACSPQAWAAATPFAMLQACLGLEVDASQRLARLRYPRLPERLHSVEVRGLPIGMHRWICCSGDTAMTSP